MTKICAGTLIVRIVVIRAIFSCMLLACFGQGLLFGSIDSQLKQVGLEDRFYLKELFRELYFHETLGHVVFYDTKPASLVCFHLKRSEAHFFDRLHYKGWLAWRCNEHLFAHPNFIFTEDIIKWSWGDCLQVAIINKTTMLKCLEANIMTFKEVLGDSFIPESFLAKIEEQNQLNSLINDNDILLGIMLGFGEESAKAFAEKNSHPSEEYSYPEWTDTYCGIELKEPKNCQLNAVGFMGNPQSDEVKSLVSSYEEELKQLWIMYKQRRNTLELVLEGLTK